MAFGLGHLRLAPHAFWSLSMRELDAIAGGMFGPNHSADQLKRTELDALLERFPDQQR